MLIVVKIKHNNEQTNFGMVTDSDSEFEKRSDPDPIPIGYKYIRKAAKKIFSQWPGQQEGGGF